MSDFEFSVPCFSEGCTEVANVSLFASHTCKDGVAQRNPVSCQTHKMDKMGESWQCLHCGEEHPIDWYYDHLNEENYYLSLQDIVIPLEAMKILMDRKMLAK